MQVTELHLHDYFSTLDGLNSPEEYMRRASELGMTHLSQTNHGTLLGHREFQKAAKDAGITPILGVEAYISSTDRFDKRAKNKRTDGTSVFNHVTLLALNETGLRSLRTLNEIAWTEGFYSKPRIDLDVLEEHHSGIVVLSGCINGLIARAIEAENFDQAASIASRIKSTFGERFFIEVQGHNPVELNQGLLHLADTLRIPAVVTSDCHYANPEDLWVEEAMLILATSPKPDYSADFSKSQKMEAIERFNYLYPGRTMTFQEIEIYLRSADEHLNLMRAQGFDRTDIIENTQRVAQMVEPVAIHEGLDLLPRPKNDSPDALLEKKAWAGLKRLGLDDKQEYIDRLNEELGIIKSLDFSTYFLVVGNMISWAKKNDIYVGPGRGSAAGSLLSYALGITTVDPIKYNLLFFRFINPARGDFPDIDMDFEHRRRGEVKEYLRRQFTHVASIATKTMLMGKNTIRDAARVYRVPLGDVNKALKGVDAPPDHPELFLDIFRKSDQGRAFLKQYPEVIRLAERFQGRIRSTGMHAGGIVVGNQPLSNFVPLETAADPNDKKGPRVKYIAADMDEAAELGLVKLDGLGLKTLSVLHDAVDAIKRHQGTKIDLDNLPLDDPKVYEMLSQGHTQGVFQCEATPYTNLLIKMGGVENFDELAATNALIRPGAMNTIGVEYIKRKNGKAPVKYLHEDMIPFTQDTYGEILYQEQVMLALTEIGGFSMADADKVRKIIGKKRDVSEFEQFREQWISGAGQKISERDAKKLWSDFEAHAGYSFNKSHAVAYSTLSYQTAYLKLYYPQYFIYAMLKNEEDKDVRTEYLIEARRLGIRVLLPHVEKSEVDFSIEGKGVRFGLSAIKGIANTSGNRLIDYRPYGSYSELRKKVEEEHSGLTKRTLSALNAVGAAAYDDNPRTGRERENFYEYLSIPAFEVKGIDPVIKAQMTPLDEYSETGAFVILAMAKKIKRGDGWARLEVVDETGTAGIFTSPDTPIETGQMYAILVSNNRVAKYMTLDELTSRKANSFKSFLAATEFSDVVDGFYRVVSFQPRKTKAGKRMADAVFADQDKNLLSVLVFPQIFPKAFTKCREGSTVMVDLANTDDGTTFLARILE
jgi:DNA polymerase III subunit alpha